MLSPTVCFYGKVSPITLTCLLRHSSFVRQLTTVAGEGNNGDRKQHASDNRSGTSSSSKPQDWTEYVHETFSIRPTYLSPCFAAYLQSKEAHERRQLLGHCIRTSSLLAYDIDGLDDTQVEQITRHRIKQLKAWCGEMTQLNTDAYLPACDDRRLMFGYFHLLEEVAQKADRDSADFHELYKGKADAWEYWLSKFAKRYEGTPSMERLEVVYSKADRQDVLSEAKEVFQKAQLRDSALPSPTLLTDLSTSGFRKTSRAQVQLKPGLGSILVNGLPFDKYFKDVNVRAYVLQPFFVTNRVGQFSVEATVRGGGQSGQAQAVRHGIAKALVVYNPLLTKSLTKLIKRDVRVVERKHHGRRKARRGFQWVKR